MFNGPKTKNGPNPRSPVSTGQLVSIEQVAQLLQTPRPSADRLHRPGSAGRAPAMVAAERGARRKAVPPARSPACAQTNRLRGRLLASLLLFARQRLDGSLKGAALRRLLDAAQARGQFLMPFATTLGLFTISGVYKTVSAVAKAASASSSAFQTEGKASNRSHPRNDVLTRFCQPQADLAQADVAIVPAGIAELDEAAIFAGDQERAGVIHSGSASAGSRLLFVGLSRDWFADRL